ncbi:MAG: GNAT family N-acetyltransferase [Solirubrobacteraceae bacterium]
MSQTAAYPEANETDVALRDGSTLHVRPVTADDRPAIEAFLKGLSQESIGFRFFGAVNLDWVAGWAVDVDYADRYALVAVSGPEHKIVAHAAYMRTSAERSAANGRAEVAFLVDDEWQGKGIATIMLAHLAAAAQEHGIAIFTAEVLPHNHRMIEVFRDSGFPVELRSGGEVLEIELPTSLAAPALERFERREQTAAVAALKSFLAPHAVAVIGASRRRRTVGAEILHNLLRGGFTGEVYPVNPNAHTVQGKRAYPTVSALPAPVELAVVAVPAAQVAGVARDCAAAGVQALLVISAGFAEMGAEGAERQRELLEICRESGMRIVGPNCLGVLSTAPEVRLDATFAAGVPLAGRVGFLSQSGGLGIAIIEAASRLGLGLSSFVSVGNKADISGNDLLHYWEHDPHTDVVLLYLESFGNPRRFARIARRVSASKPIVAVKSGRSAAGSRATSSHTGALVSASDVTVDALFAQAGVIRTDTMHELFDVASLLCAQPVPRGGRVAIVTNGGGPGILCADACQAGGLEVPRLADRTRLRLASMLAPEASTGNPIDMVATASAEEYRRTIELLVEEDAADAIVAIFVPPLVTAAEDVARELHRVAGCMGGVALCAVFMTSDGAPSQLNGGALARASTRRANHLTASGQLSTSGDPSTSGPSAASATGANHPRRVPSFYFPEDAARALAHAAGYARWRERPQGEYRALDGCRPEEAAAIVTRTLAIGGAWLEPQALAALLDCYGLPLLPTRVAANAREAVACAAEIRGPVALKAVAKGLLHKSDAGGVQLGLEGAEQVRAGVQEIRHAVAAAGHQLEGVLVQPMVSPGVELLIGVVHDESFGPVVACGAGGVNAELLRDVAVRITPLTDLDAAEMLRSLHSFPLLEGYRGAPRCDVAAIEDVLLRLSALVEAHPEVAELDFNPVVVGPGGATIVDARVRLAAVPPPHPLPSL